MQLSEVDYLVLFAEKSRKKILASLKKKKVRKLLTAIAAVLCVKRDTTLYGTLSMHSPVCMLLEANSDLYAKTCIINFFTSERNLTRLVTKESIHPSMCFSDRVYFSSTVAAAIL